MMHIAGVLFDLDGTLVDSLDLVVECFRHTCRAHLVEAPSREQIVATIGRPLRAVLEELAPGHGAALLTTYSAYHDGRHDALLRPYPEALEVARRLRDDGLPLGIVTSKRRHVAWRAVELYDLAALFTTVVSLEDTERHKPAPDPLLEGARRLGLSPERVLYVGDSTHDVLAAQAAGMPVAAALWGAGAESALRALAPDAVLSVPDNLLEWLSESVNAPRAEPPTAVGW